MVERRKAKEEKPHQQLESHKKLLVKLKLRKGKLRVTKIDNEGVLAGRQVHT